MNRTRNTAATDTVAVALGIDLIAAGGAHHGVDSACKDAGMEMQAARQ